MHKELRIRSFIPNIPFCRFLLNLSLANLFSVLTTTPLLLLTHNPNVSQPGYPLSSLTVALDAALTTAASASVLAQLLMGVDQYLAVTDPLQYRTKINKHRCLVLCCSAWIFSLVIGGLVALDGAVAIFDEDDSSSAALFSPLLSTSTFCLVFICPFLLLVYIYGRVFIAAHGNSMRTRKNSLSSSNVDAGHTSQAEKARRELNLRNHLSAGGTGTTAYHQVKPMMKTYSRSVSTRSFASSSVSSSSSSSSSMKQRLSVVAAASADAIFKREEARAARVAFVVILCLAVCWAPLCATLLVRGYGVAVPALSRTVVAALASLSPTLTPFLYAYRSRRVLRDVRRVFGLRRKQYLRRRGRFAFAAIHSHPTTFIPEVRVEAEEGQGDGARAAASRMKSLSCPDLEEIVVAEEKEGRSRKIGRAVALEAELRPMLEVVDKRQRESISSESSETTNAISNASTVTSTDTFLSV